MSLVKQKIEIGSESVPNDQQNNNDKKKSLFGNSFLYSMISSSVCNVFNIPAVSKTLDSILGASSIGQIIFGIFNWFTDSKTTAIGFLSGGIFSGSTLTLVRKNRLQAFMNQSVNVLKEENDELKESNEELKESNEELKEINEELKESNEELKENIDDLESISKKLHEDFSMLKNTIGILDDNSDEVIENLREIYNSLKKENEIHAKLNKNSIYLHILQIIKHFDNNGKNATFSLSKDDLVKAKKTLLNAFPNMDFNSLTDKIKSDKK